MQPGKRLKAALSFVEHGLWGDQAGAPTISYAQNGEDVLLSRAFQGRTSGFYIDVGANDPVDGSVTKLFYDRGFRGINIEPGAPFSRLVRLRPRDTNLQLALSDCPGSTTFYEFPESDGHSTLSKEVVAGRPGRVERSVVVDTLAGICEKYVSGTIDFLKIDVEGHEQEVIAGGDWRRWRPRIALVESPVTADGAGPFRQWEPLLVEAAYSFAAFDGINRYYVRREDESLLACFRAPLNVHDNYVAHRHLRQIEGLGPFALGAARRIQKLIDAAGRRHCRRGSSMPAS